jgi:hypothetical protein
MNTQLWKNGFGWGLVLWLIGYVLGIILFILVPANLIGWIISPVGVAIVAWVLFKKIPSRSLPHYLKIALIWTLIAIIFDYLFIVKLFKSTNYYKLDVYFYYLFTFTLPILIGWLKRRKVL